MANRAVLRDYASSGMDIQSAFIEQYKALPDKSIRPAYVLWDGLQIFNGYWMEVPVDGIVEAEFVRVDMSMAQGFDLGVSGWILLAGGEKVKLLRTWKEEHLEDFVRYRYHSPNGRMLFNNVYKRRWPDGRVDDEKWTGNAGMWCERGAQSGGLFHCSPGPLPRPDFDSMLVRVSVRPLRE